MGGLLGDALLAAALLEADADGGGVREDVAADRLICVAEHGSRAGVRGDLPAWRGFGGFGVLRVLLSCGCLAGGGMRGRAWLVMKTARL